MNLHAIAKVPFWALFLALALLYLLADGLLRGPAFHVLDAWWPAKLLAQRVATERDWAALVEGQPISRAQLDLGTDLFLARIGKTRVNLPPEQLEATESAVLDELINDALVRIWSSRQPVEAPEEFLEERVRQFESRFAPGELKAALREQDLTNRDLRGWLREHARQQFWIEEKARPAVAVTSEECREWYSRHANKLRIPEIVRARHLFLSAVFGDVAAKEKLAPELARQLRQGESTFKELCAAHSDDERTKLIGGDLGYFSRERVPAGFAGPVFAQEPGQTGEVFRTEIGWHIVRVEEKLPAREASWEEVRPGIAAYLENARRPSAIEQLWHGQMGTMWRARVHIFPRNLRAAPNGP